LFDKHRAIADNVSMMKRELPGTYHDFLAQLKALHARLQRALVQYHRETAIESMSAVAHEGEGDTQYAIDVDADRILTEFCEEWGREVPFVLVSEGISDTGERVFPVGADSHTARFRMIVDPIDGTRGLMYDKRSAWILTGVAPNNGDGTNLQDIEVALQTEIPTTKQDRYDVQWAVREQGAAGERRDLNSGEATSLALRPSSSTTFLHGFATVSNFFPGGKALIAEIEDELFTAIVGEAKPGKAQIYTDQYISTGGQLNELMVGHDRFICDIRSLVHARLLGGRDVPLCVRPYDLCTELIAREAGCVVVHPDGSPLTDPLDTKTNMSWVGHANCHLCARVQPLFEEILRHHRLI